MAREIKREAQFRRISMSDVVRERLSQPQRAVSNTGSVSEAIGEILQRSWQAHVPAASRRFSSRKKQRLMELIRGKRRRPRMTRQLAEARAVGAAGRRKFDGPAFLKLLKK